MIEKKISWAELVYKMQSCLSITCTFFISFARFIFKITRSHFMVFCILSALKDGTDDLKELSGLKLSLS